MSDRKRKDYEKKVEDDKRKQLENLLKNTPDVGGLVEKGKSALPEASRPVIYMDFTLMKDQCDLDARERISSLIEFFMPGIIHEKYVKSKKEHDIELLSSAIYGLKTSDYMMTKLMDDIDAGNGSPRHFEVLSHLQKSKVEIQKTFKSVINILEQEYKQLYFEHQDERRPKGIEDTSDEKTIDSSGVTSRGNKAMLRLLDKIENLDDFTDEAEDVE